ncbi:hypothetical protein UFOVP253_71 [uncultured Caudovirales phage]|uniref:Uncharacterized protein n=1 Tax=uncultured Caudovirales phage TaxID=2100421 RepID=A0A6J5LHV5_9CAUD|nr:hypothetical protein UFOVP253_71 [uncultured Caudovirales phage]
MEVTNKPGAVIDLFKQTVAIINKQQLCNHSFDNNVCMHCGIEVKL